MAIDIPANTCGSTGFIGLARLSRLGRDALGRWALELGRDEIAAAINGAFYGGVFHRTRGSVAGPGTSRTAGSARCRWLSAFCRGSTARSQLRILLEVLSAAQTIAWVEPSALGSKV